MKNTKNYFSILGLDPHYLRGIPDEIVTRLIKSAFRTLISYYHDDRRNQIPEGYGGDKEKIKFDERRNEIMAAFEILSTPRGRMEALDSFRKSTIGDLRAKISEQQSSFFADLSCLSAREMVMTLDRVGAIHSIEESRFTPVNHLWGGKILTCTELVSGGTAFEFTIDTHSVVTKVVQCKLVPTKKTNKIKKGWFIKGTARRADCYTVPVRSLSVPVGLTVLGTMSDDHFTLKVNKVPRAFLGYTGSLTTKTGLPFVRLHANSMQKYMYQVTPNIFSGTLVLLDTQGIFYFAGDVRGNLPANK